MGSTNKNTITVIGGINVDVTGIPNGNGIVDNSNPGEITVGLGGVACNIARNLAKLISNNWRIIFLSAIGDDIFSEFALRKLKKVQNLDTNHIATITNSGCGMYLSITEGDRITAVSDMHAVESITPQRVEQWEEYIKESQLIIIDTNLTRKTIESICRLANSSNIPIIIQNVSVQKAKRLFNLNCQISYLFFNIKEYGSAIGSIQADNIVVTLGEAGVLLMEKTQGEEYKNTFISLPKEKKIEIKNPNGAGDAFTAGFVYSLLQGETNRKTNMLFGIAAATLTLESKDTVSEKLSPALLKKLVNERKVQIGE